MGITGPTAYYRCRDCGLTVGEDRDVDTPDEAYFERDELSLFDIS
jgi:hypothetical protein